MKNKVVFILLIMLLAACANKHKNHTAYKDADLLFRYIDDSLKGKINEEKYVFATYRVGVVCSNCRGDVLLDELMDTIKNRYANTPFYVITDADVFSKSKFVSGLKKQYPQLQNIFSNKAETLERYGLYGNFPSIFLIENDNLKESLRLFKKK